MGIGFYVINCIAGLVSEAREGLPPYEESLTGASFTDKCLLLEYSHFRDRAIIIK
jgi:hypothetical protein